VAKKAQVKKQQIIAAAFLFTSLAVRAQGYIEFTENKGQWNTELKYLASAGAGAIALTQNGYRITQSNKAEYAAAMEALHEGGTGTADLQKAAPKPGMVVHGHTWYVNFENASPQAEIIASKEQPGLTNYLLGTDESKWAAGCRTFTAVTYKNMYPGIDVQYYTDNNTLKYDMVVAPGADARQISFTYEGADKLSVNKKGELIIHTSVGEFAEAFPYTFQISGNERKVIDCRYRVKGNRVWFDLGAYDTQQPLVIDPALVYCSYTRSSADNWGFTATYGADGSLYAGGFAKGTGFPASTGAYQTNYQGGDTDIAIMKFTPTLGTRVYATYIGGGQDDQVHSMVCDAAGNLVIAGRSNSGNYPVTASFGVRGNYDIVITRLNAVGNGILGSVKIGGSNDDGVNIRPSRNGRESLQYNYGDDGRSEINLDASGNVILASCTQSNNFPLQGAVQTSFGGAQDGVVLKLNSSLSSLLFSTFFGGSGNDAAYVINTNPANGDIYFGGGTESSNLPGDKTGTLQPGYAGAIDGFLGVLSPDGSVLRKVTYMGTGGHDQVYGIQFDKNQFPYVMGISLGNWPIQNATFSNPGAHQFLGKLKKDLSGWEYSTVFGTASTQTNISPVAFLVDNCENVYVGGWGGAVTSAGYSNASTTGMPITGDAIQNTTDGRDLYFIVLKKDAASQLFGSFYGVNTNTNPGYLTDHIDGGTSRFDPRGAVYMSVCACSQNTNGIAYPTTSQVWSRTKGAVPGSSPAVFPLCNLIALKIKFNYNGVEAGLRVSDSTGCVPLTVQFTDIIANGVTYEWDFGDGTGGITTRPDTAHTYTAVGNYRARLISVDPNSCNLRDTVYKTIRVRSDRATLAFTGIKQPPCTNLSYLFTNNSVPAPGKSFSATSFQWDFGDNSPLVTAGTAPQLKTYAGPGNYNVKLILTDTNFCNAPDTVTKLFRVAPFVRASFEVPNGCAPYQAQFNNTSLAGISFQWSFGDAGATSTDMNPSYLYSQPGNYNVVLIANDSNTCNKTDTFRFTLKVLPAPTAAFTYAPQPVQENTPTQFTNQSLGAVKYEWDFGDGENSDQANPLHQFNSTDTFDVCLVALNEVGCADTFCLRVPALVAPLLDVPNALTPNGDGRNDKVFVRGFGIKTIVWRIYNRFGQMVFQTNNRNEGWDGKYKGVVQPMDAYAYTLEVETSEGKKVRKQGDITLIR
jgi:gliding motility-associated-like protein